MARISTYALDTNITTGDKWIGTDGPTLATKNFSVQKIIDFLNSSGYIDSIATKFFYQTLDPGEDRSNGSITFVPQLGPTVAFSSISGFRISQLEKSGVNVSDLYSKYINSKIIIQKASDPSQYGVYNWNSSTQNITETTFYDITLGFVDGNGDMEEDDDYLISLLQLGSATGVTQIFGSTFIDAVITGADAYTLSLSATGTPSNLTGLRGDNTWGTLGLESLDEGGRQSFGSTDAPIGWRLIGRDASLYGNIGEGAIDFSSGYFQNETLPFGGSITNSPQIGSVGPGSFTLGGTVENNSNGGVVFGASNVLNGGPNIEPAYFVGGVILGQYNQSYGLNYYNLTSGYKNLIGDRTQQSWSDAGFPYPYPVQYWSGQIGMYNQMPSGYASVQLGYGLLSGGPFCTTVGVGNEDVTLSIAENIVNNRNNLNPRFIVGCGTSAGDTSNPSVGVRQNGFVVMSDGAATFPILTNAKIDAASDDSAVTKGWVQAQGTGTPTGLEAIDEGNGTGWRLIGRDSANYGNIGLNAIDFSISDSASTTKGATGVGSVTFGLNNPNPLQQSIVSGVTQNISITTDLYADGKANIISGDSNIIYNNNFDNIVSGFLNTVGTQGAVLSSQGAVVYDSIIQGTRNEVYGARDSIVVGRGLLTGSRNVAVVGMCNEDLTVTTANSITNFINDYGPRFVVGVGTWSGNSSSGSPATRANGFVVMSDGASSFPSLTNTMIDSAGSDSAVTKGWVQAQTDVNTTYDLASAQNAADVDITLTGSDASVDTLKLVAGTNVTLTDNGSDQITIDASPDALTSEQVRIEVKNTSGATLVKGTPVYITGTVGATIRAEIAAADASSSATMPAIGVLAQDLINNEDGFAVTGGFLTNITTDPIDGLTPTENDTVYVKAGGGLTLTKPVGSDLIQNIAKVGKVSGGNAGSLVISSILRTNDVPNLTEGKIWVGTAANTAESTVVHLDESNGRMGIGTTSPSEKLHVSSGYALIENTGIGSSIIVNRTDGKALNLKSGAATSQFTFDNSGRFAISADTKANVLSGAGSGNQVFTITGAGNVGIGTTSPAEKLDVAGNLYLRGTNNLTIGSTSFGGDFSLSSGIRGYKFANQNGDLLTIDSAGQLQLNTYGSGTFTGTATQRLAVDSSGNVIEIPIGSGPVDGSGTANYVTKWSDADTITDSLIYDNGTQVLIGATSSSFSDDLYINNTAYSQSGWRVGTTTTYVGKLVNSAGVLSLEADGTRSIGFRNTTNGDIVRIDGVNSRVGIGMTSPRSKLEVKGTGGNASGIIVSNTNDIIRHYFTGDALGSTYAITYDGTGGNDLQIQSDGDIILADNTGGNVGIGTTAPVDKLDISAGSIRLDDNQRISWASTDANIGRVRITGNEPNDFITFVTDNSERMRLTNTGLGIGTTAPASKLNIAGNNPDLRFDDTSALTRADLNTEIGFYDSTGANGSYIGHRGSADLEMRSTLGGMSFGTFANSVLLNLVGNNVGIGTTSPSDLLHLEGASTPTLKIVDTTNTTVTELYSNDFDTYLANESSGRVFIRTGGSNGFVVDSNGDVGIGTTNPIYKLDIQSESPAIRIQDISDANSFLVGADNSGGYLGMFTNDSLRVYTNSLERLRITDTGRVGIGTTSPVAPLNVESDADVVAVFSSTDNKAIVTIKDDDTTGYISAENSKLSLGAAAGVNTNNLNIDLSNNRVGIGTASPAYTFHVQGNSYVQNGNIYISQGAYKIANIANNAQAMSFPSSGNFAFENVNVGIGTTSPSAELDVVGNVKIGNNATIFSDGSITLDIDYNNNQTDRTLRVTQNGATNELFRIQEDGNAGIGTATPAAKLDVNGGIRMADDTATASATNVGTLRYRTSGNNSYVDMCMQTGAATYAWVNIVQNNW